MDTAVTVAPAEAKADLSEFASRYRRHLPVVLISTLVGTALFGALTFVLPTFYTATAEMTYAPQTAPDVRNITAAAGQPQSDASRDAAVQAAIQSAESLPVAERVVDAFNLTHDDVLLKKAKKYNTTGDLRGAVAMALLQSLKVHRVGETPLIDLSFTSHDPLRSAKIANGFAKAYEDQEYSDSATVSKVNSGRMNQSASALQQQAHDADAAVARFKRDHNMVYEPTSPDVGQDISLVTQALAQARGDLAAATIRAQFVERGGVNDQLIGNSPMSPLLDQKAQVSRNLATLVANDGPQHPKVIEAQHELDDINRQVADETKREADSATANVRFDQNRVNSLEASLKTVRQNQVDQVTAQTELLGLSRQADTASLLLNNMLLNTGQEVAKRVTLPPNTTLTTPADPPMQPSFPILPLDLAFGFIVGVGVGLAVAYIRERWSMGLTSNDDIHRLLGKNFFSSLPTLDSSIDKPTTRDPVAAITAHPLSLYTEAYRSLATTLRMSGPDVKVMAVTSALPKEGKTTCAINMARTLAMSGERVALLDADLRRRSISVMLAPGAKIGLVEVVRGEASLKDIIRVDESGLHIIPLAPQSHLGAQPFSTPAFNDIMETLRREYDVVLIDTAPVLAVVDVRLLLKHIDALALLARWRETPIRAIRAAIHQVETVGGEVSGVAMSLVNVNAQAHVGYGDASYYYSEMKEYYEAA